MSDASIRAGRHTVQISHPDKALFTEPTITKLQLARHDERMAPAMLPLIRDRPLALEAFPQGIAEPGFFMKSIPRHFPSWIATAKVPKRGGSLTQVLGQDTAALIYLAGQNVITPHLWLSRADEPRAPDRLIIDLDPSPGIGFAEVRAAARAAGERLRDAGLVAYAMVTGSRGVHVVCPLRRSRCADLSRRQPQQLRPARGGAVWRARQAAGPGRDADPVGRAHRRAADARPLDDRQRCRSRGR